MGWLHGSKPDLLRWNLPYHSFDHERGSSLLATGRKENSLGIVWEVEPLSVELASTQDLGAYAEDLATLFRQIPQNCTLQLIIKPQPTEGDECERWLRGTVEDHPILRKMSERRSDFIQQFWVQEGPALYFAKDLRVYLTLRSGDIPVPNVFADPEGAAERQYLAARDEFLGGAEDIEGAAASMNLRIRRYGYRDTFRLLYKWMNPCAYRIEGIPEPHEACPIAEQLFTGEVLRDWRRGTITLDGIHHRIVTAYLKPHVTTAGQLTLESVRGLMEKPIIDLIPLGHISLTLVKPDQETMRSRLAGKKMLAEAQSKISAAAAHIAEDTRGLTDFAADNHDIYQSLLHFVIGADDVSILEKRVRILRSSLQMHGFAAIAEDAYADWAFTSSLPLGVSPTEPDETERAITLHDLNAAQLAPGLMMGPASTPTPDHLFLDRRGRPFTVSLFDTPEQVGHSLICAPTGAGKSVLIKLLMWDVLRRGGYVAVLNKNSEKSLDENDYHSFAGLLGSLGRFVNFNVKEPPELDACWAPGGFDEEHNLFLTKLISELVRMGRADYELDTDQVGALSKKITEAFEYHGRRTGGRVKLSHIQRTLLASRDPVSQKLGRALGLFCGPKAPYRGFFDGDVGDLMHRSARFTCFELNQLEGAKEVLSSLMLMLFHKIRQFFETLPRDTPKLLIIEEAWLLLRDAGSGTSEYVAQRMRTDRKLKEAIAIVTQHAKKDLDSDAGRSIVGDKPNLLMLRHKKGEVSDVAGFLDLSAEERRALLSLTKRNGLYSEVLLMLPHCQGIGRVVPGPHNLWLLTSDADDRALLTRERAKMARELGRQPDLMELIDRLAEKYPGGAKNRKRDEAETSEQETSGESPEALPPKPTETKHEAPAA